MILHRVPDWRERLAHVVEVARRREFRLGAHDCCLFAADCIDAVTGIDPALDWRRTYRDQDSLLDLMAERGLTSVGAVVETTMIAWGCAEIPPTYAADGDVAVVPIVGLGDVLAGDVLVGVVSGPGVLVADRSGLARLKLRRACRAWRIG